MLPFHSTNLRHGTPHTGYPGKNLKRKGTRVGTHCCSMHAILLLLKGERYSVNGVIFEMIHSC